MDLTVIVTARNCLLCWSLSKFSRIHQPISGLLNVIPRNGCKPLEFLENFFLKEICRLGMKGNLRINLNQMAYLTASWWCLSPDPLGSNSSAKGSIASR